MGLIVVAAYGAISVAGLSFWEVLRPRMFDTQRIPFEVQALVAAVGAMLAGILPVSAAAWLQTIWERRQALHDPAPNPRPPSMVLVAIAAAVIAAALLPVAVQARWYVFSHVPPGGTIALRPPGIGPYFSSWLVIRTILVVLAFLLSIGYCLRVMYRRTASSKWIIVLFIAFTWLGPPIVDFTVNGAMKGFESESFFTAVSAGSPPVALIYLWTQPESAGASSAGTFISPNPGIVFQWLVAAALAFAFYAGRRTGPATAAAVAG